MSTAGTPRGNAHHDHQAQIPSFRYQDLRPLQLLDRTFASKVAGFESAGRFKQQGVHFVIRDGHVLEASRHDDEYPSAEAERPDPETAS